MQDLNVKKPSVFVTGYGFSFVQLPEPCRFQTHKYGADLLSYARSPNARSAALVPAACPVENAAVIL